MTEIDPALVGLSRNLAALVQDGHYVDGKRGRLEGREAAVAAMHGMIQEGWDHDHIVSVMSHERFGVSKAWLEIANGDPNKIRMEIGIAYKAVRSAYEKKNAQKLKAEEQTKSKPEFIALADCDEAKLPKRDWLAKDIFQRGKLSVIAGQGGSCKSTLELYAALAIATNTEAGPFKPTAAYNVGIINVEDDIDEQRLRMFALLKTPDFKNVRPQRDDLFVASNLHTLKCDAATLVVRNEDSGRIVPTETYKWLVGEIKRLKLDIIFIDPLVEITDGINENDNAHMQKVMACLRLIGRDLNCHVCVVHHFNKPGEANNPGAVRGGSSIINAARMNLNVEKFNDKDCEAYGVSEDDRHNRVKLIIPKANNSATGAVHFFAIEEKHLANGEFVAALQSWEPTSDLEPVTPEIINKFLDDLERGRVDKKAPGDRYTDATTSRKEPRADQLLIKAGLAPKQAHDVIKRLKQQGCIAMQTYTNSHREEVEGLIVLKRPTAVPF